MNYCVTPWEPKTEVISTKANWDQVLPAHASSFGFFIPMGTVLMVIGTGMRSSWDELVPPLTFFPGRKVSCKRALTIGVNCSMCEVMKWLEDLSKAFDSLPHQLLVAKLQAYELDEYSCLLLMDYLQCRQKRVKVGDTVSPWEHIPRGLHKKVSSDLYILISL